MKKSECLIRGYELGKNTRLHGEIKLAKEISDLNEREEIDIKCLSCKFNYNLMCNCFNEISINPGVAYRNEGMSSLVVKCDQYKPND